MPGLRLQVRRELEAKFREAAMRRFGFVKGALSRAAEEALEGWLARVDDVHFEGDPVQAIEGLLSDVKMDAVELQHWARQRWAERAAKYAPR